MSDRNIKTSKNQIAKMLKQYPAKFDDAYDRSALEKRQQGDLSLKEGTNTEDWTYLGHQTLNGERQFAFSCPNSVFKSDAIAIVSFEGNTTCDFEVVTRAFAKENYEFDLTDLRA